MTADDDDKAAQANIEVRRNRIIAWMWSVVLIPPGIAGYFVLDFEAFTRITVLATWVLSAVTLTISQLAVAKGAESKAAGYENP